jgi:hypothetical protein
VGRRLADGGVAGGGGAGVAPAFVAVPASPAGGLDCHGGAEWGCARRCGVVQYLAGGGEALVVAAWVQCVDLLGWRGVRHLPQGWAPTTGYTGMLLRTVHAIVVQFVTPCCVAAVAFSSRLQLLGVCAVVVGVGVGVVLWVPWKCGGGRGVAGDVAGGR